MNTSANTRRVLVLFWHPDPPSIRNSIRQHLHMLEAGDVKHEVWYCNTFDAVPSSIRHLPFDAVILHTTLLCLRWSHLFSVLKWRLRWVADLDCVKIALPQDEYDHSEILDEWLYEWGVSVIFSNFDEPERRVLYPLMRDRARFHKALTGYIDEAEAAQISQQLTPTVERPLDVVYRASRLPYWFGSHGQLKHRIGAAVRARATALGLRVDISTREEDTIVGAGWLQFLASGKCVVGCESGSSVLDRRGEVRSAIQHMLRGEPSLSFDEVSRRMDPGWDEHTFFAISPRHLEAITTRTCQILVEGCYTDILIPERHYIPVRRDLSNLDQALEKCRDSKYLSDMADRAYEEVYLSGKQTYGEFSKRMNEVLCQRPRNRRVFVPVAARALGLTEAPASWSVDQKRRRASQPRREGWIRVTLSPSNYVLKGLAALSEAIRDRQLRTLIVRARRANVGLDRVLEDVLKLALARRHETFGISSRIEGRVLRLVSCLPGEPVTRLSAAEAERLICSQDFAGVAWDHSRVGKSIAHRTLGYEVITYLPDGLHRFETLATVARDNPMAVVKALSPLLVDPALLVAPADAVVVAIARQPDTIGDRLANDDLPGHGKKMRGFVASPRVPPLP